MINRLLDFFSIRSSGYKGDGKVDDVVKIIDKGMSPYDNREQVSEWIDIYEGNPSWLNNEVEETLNIAALVSSELARLSTIEFKSSIVGKGAEDVNDWYQTFIKDMRKIVEYMIVQGSVVLKPYIQNDKMYVEVVPSDEFVPLKFDGAKNMTSAVFIYKSNKGDESYTRLEIHDFNNDEYIIENRAFRDKNGDSYKDEVPLTEVSEWADLEPMVALDTDIIRKPLFIYMTTPYANSKNIKSPLGVSVLSKIGSLLKEIDIQWEHIKREYAYKRVKIFFPDHLAPTGAMMNNYDFNIDDIEDMFIFVEDSEKGIDTFSPEFRDVSLFNGLEEIKRLIEFSSGLAYGSLSRPDNVEKTAEEIRSGKERSYNTVRDIQKYIRSALERLADTMTMFAVANSMMKDVEYKVSFHFDDSIVIDEKTDIELMYKEVKDGLLKPEYYIAKRYGLTKEEALEMMGDFGQLSNDKPRENKEVVDVDKKVDQDNEDSEANLKKGGKINKDSRDNSSTTEKEDRV